MKIENLANGNIKVEMTKKQQSIIFAMAMYHGDPQWITDIKFNKKEKQEIEEMRQTIIKTKNAKSNKLPRARR